MKLNFPSNHGNTNYRSNERAINFDTSDCWTFKKTEMTPGSWGWPWSKGALLSHRRGSWTGSVQLSISQTSVLVAGISLLVTYCHLSVHTHTKKAVTATPGNTRKLEQPRYTCSPPPPSASSSGSQQVRVAETRGPPWPPAHATHKAT